MKDTITKEDYLKLLGLKKISEDLNDKQHAVEASIASIIGEEKSKYGSYDWSGDIIYSGNTIDYFLSQQVEIEVEGGREF